MIIFNDPCRGCAGFCISPILLLSYKKNMEDLGMEFDKSMACCFTGHRPERLEMSEKKVINWLDEQIHKAVEDKYTYFISGMQRGVDIWAAEIVLKMKKEGAPVKLIAACAFKGMEGHWEKSWIDRYNAILAEAEDIVYIGNHPSRAAFFMRNEWMVDHSSRLIAVYTGAPGGTQKTISYAKKNGCKVVSIDR